MTTSSGSNGMERGDQMEHDNETIMFRGQAMCRWEAVAQMKREQERQEMLDADPLHAEATALAEVRLREVELVLEAVCEQVAGLRAEIEAKGAWWARASEIAHVREQLMDVRSFLGQKV